MGDDYPRAIDLVTSGGVNVRATHRESLDASPELFKARAQNQPSYVKALLYPNGENRDGPN
jgi:threonine dehydrogenase-like Zn-dependent dehydrogenase